jgi:hypothetical protein
MMPQYFSTPAGVCDACGTAKKVLTKLSMRNTKDYNNTAHQVIKS